MKKSTILCNKRQAKLKMCWVQDNIEDRLLSHSKLFDKPGSFFKVTYVVPSCDRNVCEESDRDPVESSLEKAGRGIDSA
jgi:hypothetical protein